ncbi:MAG TPA: acyl-[ACP]--phospholipid O-acyltransferase [Planctomycetaceae bacterium]|jgi:acyl-[acyl-carrier-protein]-phospholipid O-acyltransferase/long-chain-fatty-acid--[acyl-carrier-protein] ligase|nr:acyl-[ACP]--phospholipid O-acyltransferase [Planctomycetaceae bacterium]
MEANSDNSQPRGRAGLASPSFIGLLLTQFLGTLNDNMFRWFVVPLGKEMMESSLALSLGLVCFTLPYALLAAPAGYLADRFSKRTVIVACKVAEVLLVILGSVAVMLGSIHLLFVVVALMGAQAALFAPSKYGSIAEILRPEKLTKGNGLMGLVTIVSSALGFVAGNGLYVQMQRLFEGTGPILMAHPGLAGVARAATAFVSVALLGLGASLMIRPLPIADRLRRFPKNMVKSTYAELKLLARDRTLFRTALGIAFFWFLASLAQMNIDSYGTKVLALGQEDIGPLLAMLVVGVGLGSVLAGLWSGGKVELGLVPLGATGIVLSAFLLYLTGNSVATTGAESAMHRAFGWSCVWLFTLGISSGLFDIPLESYLQQRSEVKTRGTILAAANFIAYSFMIVAAGLFWLMQSKLHWTASTIFLAAGLGTVPVAIYVVCLIPQATVRCIVWILSKLFYRLHVRGLKNLPERGGALLVANHVSWLDGVLLLLVSNRPIRMIAWSDYVTGWWIGWLSKMWEVIPIRGTDGPKALLRSLDAAKEALLEGDLVCIFAEGGITRTGQLQPFQRGLMRIVDGTGCPVIPVYLDELWGSIFSYSGGKFFWKMPRHWPYPISILFGKPLDDPDDINQIRQAVQNLGVEAVEARKERILVPPRQAIRRLKKCMFQPKVADSSGTELKGGRLLAGSLILRELLLRDVIGADEKMVGILLPPAVGSVVANLAVSMMPRVAVNLNYTLSNPDVNHCIREAGIKHVITSARFLEKRPFDLDCQVVLLEDLLKKVTRGQKLIAALKAYFVPSFILERMLGLERIKPDDLMTVIFTSGSTGEPKGVMQTHKNIATNLIAANQLLHFTTDDVLMGVLPFFHSFGYTFPLWLIASGEPGAVYHFNPVEARVIGKLCEKHKVTVIAATPTFIKRYLKRCEKEQFRTVNLVITGAEKLPQDLAQDFEAKFGIFPTEGYGTTELSPLAACNVPKSRSASGTDEAERKGTIGRAIPNVVAKIVDPDTRADLGINQEGLLWIKGPNVMVGYLNNPQKTAEVIHDGWYNTGDIGKIDSDGFIHITGRQSRFSKIAGEMVPHIRIEELLTKIVEDPNDEEGEGEVHIAVTAVPDADKGERIIVLHKPLAKSVDQVLKELGEADIPNLWLPSADSFIEVPEIPILGTGKLDLKAVKELALAKTSKCAPAQPAAH